MTAPAAPDRGSALLVQSPYPESQNQTVNRTIRSATITLDLSPFPIEQA